MGSGGRSLRGGVLALRAGQRVPETEDDAGLRDAGRGEVDGDAIFGAVPLNPDLVADDLHMDEASMKAAHTLRAVGDDQVLPACLVKDGDVCEVAVRVLQPEERPTNCMRQSRIICRSSISAPISRSRGGGQRRSRWRAKPSRA